MSRAEIPPKKITEEAQTDGSKNDQSRDRGELPSAERSVNSGLESWMSRKSSWVTLRRDHDASGIVAASDYERLDTNLAV